MNASEIIKNIEAEQLKADAPEFRVGIPLRFMRKLKKETVKEFRFSKVLY